MLSLPLFALSLSLSLSLFPSFLSLFLSLLGFLGDAKLSRLASGELKDIVAAAGLAVTLFNPAIPVTPVVDNQPFSFCPQKASSLSCLWAMYTYIIVHIYSTYTSLHWARGLGQQSGDCEIILTFRIGPSLSQKIK